MLAPPLDQLVPIAVLLSFSLTLIRRRPFTDEELHMSEVPEVRLTPEAMHPSLVGVADWRAEFSCARCGVARVERFRGTRATAEEFYRDGVCAGCEIAAAFGPREGRVTSKGVDR